MNCACSVIAAWMRAPSQHGKNSSVGGDYQLYVHAVYVLLQPLPHYDFPSTRCYSLCKYETLGIIQDRNRNLNSERKIPMHDKNLCSPGPRLLFFYQLPTFQVLNRAVKHSNPEWYLTPTVSNAGKLKQWNEHLLCECVHYSQQLWIYLGEIITLYLISTIWYLILRVELSQLNVIYSIPHPSLLLPIPISSLKKPP
jgi:hypothetical protein